MVPEQWSNLKLSEITKEKISYGIVQAGPHVPEGVPYIKSSDISFSIDPEKLQRTSKEIHYKYRRSAVHPGDIVFSLRGNIAECAIIPGELEEANLTQGTARISVDSRNNNLYVYYQLQNQPTRNRINALSKGSTFKEISLEELRKISIPVAPLSEQVKIAKILSTWDKAIEVTEKLIENSKAQKKGLMQQLLTGSKRLTGFSKEWQRVSIKKMGKTVSGGTPDTDNKEYWDGNVLWATPTDITSLHSRYINYTKRKITGAGIKDSSASLLPKGAILVCTRATIGYLAIAGRNITTNQGFKSLILGSQYNSEFIYYLFVYFKHQFIRYACGSTFLELSKRDFEKREFFVPEKKEQEKIAAILEKVDDEIDALYKSLNHLKSQKIGLMQQLLTGKRRVKVDMDARLRGHDSADDVG